MSEPAFTIVIPAFNEADVIGKTVDLIKAKEAEAAKAGSRLEVLVVDNNSSDETGKIAEAAGARVISEPRQGYGYALRAGLNAAEGDIVIMGDADLTYPLEDFLEFSKPILDGGYDMVIGNRYHRRIEKGALKPINQFGGRVLSIIGNRLFGTQIRDWHCGMRAFTKEAIITMGLKAEGMEFASEIIVQCKRKNLNVYQRDINYRRREGETKLNVLRDGWRHVVYLVGSFLQSPEEPAPTPEQPANEKVKDLTDLKS